MLHLLQTGTLPYQSSRNHFPFLFFFAQPCVGMGLSLFRYLTASLLESNVIRGRYQPVCSDMKTPRRIVVGACKDLSGYHAKDSSRKGQDDCDQDELHGPLIPNDLPLENSPQDSQDKAGAADGPAGIGKYEH